MIKQTLVLVGAMQFIVNEIAGTSHYRHLEIICKFKMSSNAFQPLGPGHG